MTFCIAEFLKSGAIVSLSKDRLFVGWGKPCYFSKSDLNTQNPAFYFSDFFLTNFQPWIQYPHWMEISTEKFNQHLSSLSPCSACNWVIGQPARFKEAFDDLQQLLQIGQLQKAVPYLFANSSSLMNEERLLKCLKRAIFSLGKQNGYLYGHWYLSSGVLGLTPELLFSHSQNQPQKVATMALAGTCPVSACHDSFLKNEKELYEHQLVVQGICQALNPLGDIQISKLQLLQLPRLTHLMTPIEINLNHSFCFDTLVKCLHPTPALGAFPIQEGKKWLEDYQKHIPRNYFGAPIGFRYPSTGSSQCFVGIRNVQWDHSGMRIGAGCGVVKQSTYEKEWQEIQFKIKAIQDQLHL